MTQDLERKRKIIRFTNIVFYHGPNNLYILKNVIIIDQEKPKFFHYSNNKLENLHNKDFSVQNSNKTCMICWTKHTKAVHDPFETMTKY